MIFSTTTIYNLCMVLELDAFCEKVAPKLLKLIPYMTECLENRKHAMEQNKEYQGGVILIEGSRGSGKTQGLIRIVGQLLMNGYADSATIGIITEKALGQSVAALFTNVFDEYIDWPAVRSGDMYYPLSDGGEVYFQGFHPSRGSALKTNERAKDILLVDEVENWKGGAAATLNTYVRACGLIILISNHFSQDVKDWAKAFNAQYVRIDYWENPALPQSVLDGWNQLREINYDLWRATIMYDDSDQFAKIMTDTEIFSCFDPYTPAKAYRCGVMGIDVAIGGGDSSVLSCTYLDQRDHIVVDVRDGTKAETMQLVGAVVLNKAKWHANFEVFDCFPGAYEVLTPNGWKRLDACCDNENVACWDINDRTVRFGVADKVVTPMFDLLHYKGKKIDLSCSPGHRFLLESKWNHKLHTVLASDLDKYNNHSYRIPTSFVAPEGPEYELSLEDWLNIVIQADGCVCKKWANKQYVEIELKKQRKIDRFKTMAEKYGLRYKEYPNNQRGTIGFRFSTPIKDYKTLGFDLSGITKQKAQTIIEEISLWDGSRNKTRDTVMYYSNRKDNVELVQVIAIMAGYNANVCISAKHKKPVWKVEISKKATHTGIQLEKCDTITTERYMGQLYCFKTPYDTIILRNEQGRIFITHNCDGQGKAVIQSRMPGTPADRMRKGIIEFHGGIGGNATWANNRTMGYGLMAQLAREGRLHFIGDTMALEKLQEDLRSQILTRPQKYGQIQLAHKDQIKKILGRSPDYSDSVMMGVWYLMTRAMKEIGGVQHEDITYKKELKVINNSRYNTK